ncbi:type II toxin-antitoxin system YafQ family toxin [Pectinatus haikarae]|uniref:mRNA interferase YafQ n=1 Tax=Pectinatus haikarae TaxID=349096 RepID=A0ABT9YC27_9FIRM|nr:mRNA interferase YafQ [Pectinatus haikarae]
MLKIEYGTAFKKDFKKIKKRGYNPAYLEKVLELLIELKSLPSKYKDHALIGNYKGFRECHIQPDWLLIYRIDEGANLNINSYGQS